MRRGARRTLILAATLPLLMVAAVVWPNPAAAGTPGVPAQYRIVNLGGLSPDGTGDAMAINDHGEVVGFSTAPNGYMHPFLWRNGVMTDLGALEPGGVEYGVAADINNRGEVVGSGDVFGGTAMHAFLWRNGVMRDLGTLGGAYSTATAINDRGQIIGNSSAGDGSWHPFLWENGHMRALDIGSIADLNNRGDIVGTGIAGAYHGYLLRRGVQTDLGTLPGGTFSEARAVNNLGWIAGDADTAARPHVRGAFLWRDGTMYELPGPAGSTYSSVTTLNDRGQVIGQSTVYDQFHQVLWQNGTAIDLTTRGIPSGGMLDAAGQLRDINRSGQIAGAYYFTYGRPGPALFV